MSTISHHIIAQNKGDHAHYSQNVKTITEEKTNNHKETNE